MFLSALGQDQPAKTDKPSAATAVFDMSFDPTLKESVSASRSAEQDEIVVGKVAPQGKVAPHDLQDQMVQEHGDDPVKGPDLEVISNEMACSEEAVENQKEMLATVQSLIKLVCFPALPVSRAMRRFRDLLFLFHSLRWNLGELSWCWHAWCRRPLQVPGIIRCAI